MANISFDELIFSELRVIPITLENTEVTDERLTQAMTINEEMCALGYTLKPADIIQLAKADVNTLKTFLNTFKKLIGQVKAKPMYPNFPTQVMEIDEAVFRLHQMVHYFTTYGIELLTGQPVTKGWLPEVEDTEKTVDDTTLLKAKVVALFVQTSDNTIYDYAFKKILSKRERMTDKDKMIIKECLANVTNYDVTVPFKQNLLDVFYTIFSSTCETDKKLSILHSICQHTGDVWKCMDYVLTRCKFHFRTSQKRLIVKLLESYPINDFRNNLLISNKKGLRVNLMLQYLDFNQYSRDTAFVLAVAEFRNNDMKSWESVAKTKIENHEPNALAIMCSRPGTALRKITYLLRNGYSSEDIFLNMKPYANQLSIQTLVSVITQFGCELTEDLQNKYVNRLTDKQKAKYKYGLNFYEIEKERIKVYDICRYLLREKFLSISTPLQAKKVYVDMHEYDLQHSVLLTNDKSAEGGYIRSGIAYKIPDNIDILRFFVYWNHPTRTDIDLHAYAKDECGNPQRIGWNDDFRGSGLVFSGDITHSDAAEYIDIDFRKAKVDHVTFNINVYCGPTFKNFQEVFVGALAVDKLNANVKLYNSKNCFFTHHLTSDAKFIHYGYVDVKNRCIIFDGKTNNEGHFGNYYSEMIRPNTAFPLSSYLIEFYVGQGITIVDTPEDADYVLVMGKPNSDKEISLIDNNFFMDY